MSSPYRDSLAACCRRREVLMHELEQLDRDISARAVLVIPSFTGPSRWGAWKIRRAWATIRRLGQWGEDRADRVQIGGLFGHSPGRRTRPAPPPSPPIRIITEGKVRKGGVNRQRPHGERPPPPAPGRKQVRDGKGDLVCGFPTTEPTLFGDPEFRFPQPPPSKVEK